MPLKKKFWFILVSDFEGCFKVHAYLSLSNASQIWQDVSIRSCMILCHQRTYKYAALHNGNECACLNNQEVSKLEKLQAEACDVPCSVNDEERCGGKTAASIFLAVAQSILSADERAAGLNGESTQHYLKETDKATRKKNEISKGRGRVRVWGSVLYFVQIIVHVGIQNHSRVLLLSYKILTGEERFCFSIYSFEIAILACVPSTKPQMIIIVA